LKSGISRSAFIVFSSLLLVLSTLQPAFAADPTNIVATDAETDEVNSFTELDAADDVEVFTISGSTYAIVTSFTDSGVQIINITDPANIVATDSETDGVNSFTELSGADDVEVFTISGSTYAIVASQTDDGVQIINISDPANIVATDSETDGVTFPELDGARSVDVFTISGSTYAIVASFVDNGVQIINISDPANIVATDSETDGVNSFAVLSGARGVRTFTISTSTYAIVTAQADSGVQMINITDPANIVAIDSETDGVNSFAELSGATGVDTFTISTSTYAIVASQTDSGVQIINITDPANIVATDSETDGVNSFAVLGGARGVDTFTISTSTYAIVASATDSGVQIINITDPANIVATDSETDGVNSFTELSVATGVDTFTISTSTYAIVASFTDDGVQIITLNSPSSSSSSLSSSSSSSGNSEDSGDQNPPTLGVDVINSKRLVTDGFTYNANPVNVQLYYTPYPLITANIGNNNTAEFKIYDNSGPDKIRHFDFAFGLAKGQILSDSKVRIEWDKAWNGEEIITLIDPNNVLQNVTVSSQTINCQDTSNDQCLLLVIYHTFRAPLEFDIVATNVWDEKRNAWQNYYNHGIEITGESLNPPKQYSGIDKGHIYHITETGKNTAIDEFGNTWTFSDTWIKNYIKNEIPQDFDYKVMDRTHSNFSNFVDLEATKAVDQLLVLCSTCLKSFDDFAPHTTITYPERINKLDNPEIQKKMAFESDRAQKTMDALLDIHSSTTWHKR